MSQHLLTLSKEIESFNARLFLKKYKVLFCYVSLFYTVQVYMCLLFSYWKSLVMAIDLNLNRCENQLMLSYSLCTDDSLCLLFLGPGPEDELYESIYEVNLIFYLIIM